MTQGQSRSVPPSGRGSATLYTFVALLLLIFVFTFQMVSPYLLAILMGAILAIITDRLYQALTKRTKRPRLASFIVTIGILLLILAPVLAFTLVAVRQGIALGEKLSSTKALSFPTIIDTLSRSRMLRFWIGNPAAIENQIHGWLKTVVTGLTSAIVSVAANIPALLLQIVLVCLSCYFLLVDGKRFLLWIANKIPIDRDVRFRLIESFRSTAVSVILASVASAAVQAALMLASFLVLGVPLAFLGAGATFLAAWVPIVGSSPIWLAATIYLYLQDDPLRTVLMLTFGMIIGVSDNFVRPLVLGGRSSLHPLVTLVAIFGGIQMFGYLGVFVGPILMAILISLLQVWPDVAQRFGLVLDTGSPPALKASEEKAKSA